MDVSLRQVRSFLVVARTGSFTRAAARLNMSQPTLTVQIRCLEAALGVRLFDRNTRAVALTRVGRELLPHLSRTVEDLDSVLADLRDGARETRGIVRIAALPSFAAGILPDLIRGFCAGRPGVSFQLRDVVAGRMPPLLQAEEVDLALTGGDVEAGTLEVLLAANDAMQVVHPLGHPIAKVPEVTAAVLAAHPLVLMHRDTSVRAVTDAAFAKAGLGPVPAAEATYMMTAVGMVRAGIGLAILPASAREVRAEAGVGARRIDDSAFTRPIALVKRRGRSLPPVTQAFVAFLAAAHPSTWSGGALAVPGADPR
jgi:DNA-binding transcriptional LysR family regulator